jgi:hypothetical protein
MIYTVEQGPRGEWDLRRDGVRTASFLGPTARADADFALIAFTLRDAGMAKPVVQPLRQPLPEPEQGSITWNERPRTG